MSGIKISLCICVWNTSHLLKRSIETYCNQDFPKDEYELIIVDDNSEDDVQEAIKFAQGKINMTYIRLDHNYGMRGNTFAFNTAFKEAKGGIIAETTAETMFPKNMIRSLYEPHLTEDRIFVAAKTYNLTNELQQKIDSVDWRKDLYNIMQLEGFFNDWTLNNFKNTHFGTHQTCSISKRTFYDIFPQGFPLYADYGSEDPAFCGAREVRKVKDITIMSPMAIHQWHPSFQYWQSKGKAPNLNKYAHSMSNFMHDKTGAVPNTGTCEIWDGGSHEMLSEQEIEEFSKMDDMVAKTGVPLDLIKGIHI